MDTFKRYEKKYIISSFQKEELEKRIQDYMELDSYCKLNKHYLVRNLYYDTDNNELIHKSIDKPAFKEKLRVRKYGTYMDNNDEYFLEIKRKNKKIVYKRRVALTKKELDLFLNDGISPKRDSYLNQQVNNELKYFFSIYNLKPKVLISYQRVAYYDKSDSTFRLTFDNEIHAKRNNLDFEDSNYEKDLLPEGYYIMEVKVSNSFPIWFARILGLLEIYPASFSKYGEEYKLLIMEENEKWFYLF